ncbi:MAG TPA: sigma-70 family RNA polymerase sigma factor [Chitinophagales bacterium]|nr:sigma-70 family RNA polymerase sigma factor [Chitinophagales bacterium]
MEISDSQILSAFKDPSTKEEGFKLLMGKYQQRLYWQIRRLVLDHDDADDVLQNVFIKVWNHLGKFQEQSQLFTWLYRIAVNESLTFLSRKKRKGTESLDDEASNLSSKLTADRYFDGDDLQKRLQMAIASLPEKQRQVFLLRYYDEMTYEEMSHLLGTSEGALKASYHFAVKKIEIFLSED